MSAAYVWITKNVLTQGIELAYGNILESIDPNCFCWRKAGLTHYAHKGQWHLTAHAAEEAAEKMRQKEIARLKSKLATLSEKRIKAPRL